MLELVKDECDFGLTRPLQRGPFSPSKRAQELHGTPQGDIDPLAFLPPGDFPIFSVSLGQPVLTLSRRKNTLWAYVDTGGTAITDLLEGHAVPKPHAALVRIDEKGHGVFSVDGVYGPNSQHSQQVVIRVDIDNRVVKVQLGGRGIFVGDMGSLAPALPDDFQYTLGQQPLAYGRVVENRPHFLAMHNGKKVQMLALRCHGDEVQVASCLANNLDSAVMPKDALEDPWVSINYAGQAHWVEPGANAPSFFSLLGERATLVTPDDAGYFGRLPMDLMSK